MKKTIDGVTYKRRKERTPCGRCAANTGDLLCLALMGGEPCYHAWKKLKLKVGSKLKVGGERYVAVQAKVARGEGCVGCDALSEIGLCNKLKRASEEKFNGDACDFTADVIWAKLVEVAADEIPAAPADDGWIAWTGGECPVGPRTKVEVELRRDAIRDTHLAATFRWDHRFREDAVGTGGGDIVAYRVIEEGVPLLQHVRVIFDFPAHLTPGEAQGYVKSIMRTAINGTDREPSAYNELIGWSIE